MAESIPYADALKRFGLRGDPSKEQILKKFKQLAKKTHPDVADNIEAAQQFMRLVEAKNRLLRGKTPKAEMPPIDWKKYYNYLQQKLPKEPTEAQLNEIFAKEIKKKKFRKNREEEAKLAAAFDQLRKRKREEAQFTEDTRNRARSHMRRAAYKQLYDDEEKDIMEKKQKAQQLMLFYSIDNMLYRLYQLLKRSLKIGKVFYSPIVAVKKNGKKYKKHIKLTAGLLIGIVGGKYIWDKMLQGYRRNKGNLVPVKRGEK